MAKQDDDAIMRRLIAEAADEEAIRQQAQRDAKMDDAFDADIVDLLGGASLSDAPRGFAKSMPNLDPAEVAAAREAMLKAQKALKGGWLSRPDPEKAAQIINGNPTLRHAAERSKGCVVVLVGLGATLAGLAAGVVELAGRLL